MDKLDEYKMDGSAEQDHPRIFAGQHLTAIDVPLGAVGGSVIRMNGKAQRQWWHIFNNFEERKGSGWVPNSFFALRTCQHGEDSVRALQTEGVGPFAPMDSLTFRSEYPFACYDFLDKELGAHAFLEAFSFLIPMDLKSSAIPAAVYRITVKNTADAVTRISLLAAQQNAVGFDGYEPIAGAEDRCHSGYGSNENRVVNNKGRCSLVMTGDAGSMVLSAYTDEATGTAAWSSLAAIHGQFLETGTLSGPDSAKSPSPGVTVDGALSLDIKLEAKEERSFTFVLSWHISKGSFGKPGAAAWNFSEEGCYYENWWSDAKAVDNYVFDNFKALAGGTRLYRDTLYGGNIPLCVKDRIASNLSVLKSPTSFWTKAGYYGLWESTSNHEEWLGNCKHVYHYAQAHARLFPELGRRLRKQDLASMTDKGLLPARDGDEVNALDGHCGSLLATYREHLLSTDDTFLKKNWGDIRRAMDYMINNYDPSGSGMLSGCYHNTLDCNISGTSSWIGSLYLAALKACAVMAEIVGDQEAENRFISIFDTGRVAQDQKLWSETLGYYLDRTEGLPKTLHMGDGVCIDMVLGQWWANQLGLGEIYPPEHVRRGLLAIYKHNRFTDVDGAYACNFRDFLGKGDTGWQMCAYPNGVHEKPVRYYNEVMSGFEYSFAATLIQYGLTAEGLTVVHEIYKRYDGRLRAEGEVHMANNSTVYGCGSPVGEDECGDFYGRPMSSWSTLLALQGFQYNGPEQTMTFNPVWKPDDHQSFFSGAQGWGLYTQTRQKGTQTCRLEIRYGELALKQLTLYVPEGTITTGVTIENDDATSDVVAFRQAGSSLLIDLSGTAGLESRIRISAGNRLTVFIRIGEKVCV
jgi:uncharacterized protein (DUF608 family)